MSCRRSSRPPTASPTPLQAHPTCGTRSMRTGWRASRRCASSVSASAAGEFDELATSGVVTERGIARGAAGHGQRSAAVWGDDPFEERRLCGGADPAFATEREEFGRGESNVDGLVVGAGASADVGDVNRARAIRRAQVTRHGHRRCGPRRSSRARDRSPNAAATRARSGTRTESRARRDDRRGHVGTRRRSARRPSLPGRRTHTRVADRHARAAPAWLGARRTGRPCRVR